MSYMNNAIFVTSVDKLPAGEHWAIIESSSVHHEESGVWAPGHGYPAYSEPVVTYTAFLKKEDFEAELKRRLSDKWHSPVRGIHVAGIFKSETVIQLQEK